jgi:hypothetical protein
MVQFYYNFVVPESTLQEVSGKVDIGFQVSTFLGFHWFLSVATVGKPVETKMTNYWCSEGDSRTIARHDRETWELYLRTVNALSTTFCIPLAEGDRKLGSARAYMSVFSMKMFHRTSCCNLKSSIGGATLTPSRLETESHIWDLLESIYKVLSRFDEAWVRLSLNSS